MKEGLIVLKKENHLFSGCKGKIIAWYSYKKLIALLKLHIFGQRIGKGKLYTHMVHQTEKGCMILVKEGFDLEITLKF